MLPKVFIVGAGPGDPGLISVRGRQRLESADVIVYDRKVHARLLRLARPEAERIEVGAAAPRPLDQEAISLLLVEKAREGKIVVRLKWGDPFVFDSGGKEALFLHEQQVPFEVVPGIPAAVGVPAYAGIPLTYPDAGDLVLFVRGHESENDAGPQVDWSRVATRASEQAGELVDMLEDRGAEAILAPTIRIVPPEDVEALDRACAEAGRYDWIVFTSANGVEHFMRRLLANGDIRDLKGPRICTIGPATTEQLARFGIRVDLTPEEYRAEAVAAALKDLGNVRGKRFLLPRADIAREVLADQLRDAGATVTEVAAYR